MTHKPEIWMRQALKLARRGAGFAAPNPMVGAVIVREGKVIGTGWHKRYGGPHAEVEALADCRKRGHDPAGAELFVTLEPCCHTGKTGPCTLAIAQAGIGKVTAATLDDFEQVNGKGAGWLRDQGIAVEVGCCQAEARELNGGFFKLQRTGMPRVLLKWAQSLDGHLAWPAGHPQRWLTNEAARLHLHQERALCTAILVGSQTVLQDDPLLTVRLAGGKRHFRPLRVVLDGRLQIPLASRLATSGAEAGVLIYTSGAALREQSEKVAALRELDCQVQAVGQRGDRLDLHEILADLGRRGVVDLMVEGGAAVLASFLREGLADRVMAYIAPIIMGGPDTPRLAFDPIGVRLEQVAMQSFGTTILLRGNWPEPTATENNNRLQLNSRTANGRE